MIEGVFMWAYKIASVLISLRFAGFLAVDMAINMKKKVQRQNKLNKNALSEYKWHYLSVVYT